MSLSGWKWSEQAVCPHTFDCSNGLKSFDIGRAPSYVSLVSSFLSCLGSILIVLTYCLLKDMRSGAQTVITLLAIADFFTAFGYIMGGVNFLINFTDSPVVDYNCPVFTSICEIQSFITTWSTMSSYCWTCILAFYFFLVLVYSNSKLASRLIPLYNVIAWIAPMCIVVPLLVFNKLGYAPYVASNWCYIKDMNYDQNLSHRIDTIVYILIAGKLWEVMCYVFITVLYVWIKISVNKTKSRLEKEGDTASLPKIVTVEKRLLAIPILYIFLRMWGTIQFFYSLGVSGTNHEGCIPESVKIVYLVLGIFQAIGDGGQGWCNAILYIILSPTIRRKLCGEPCESCLHRAERRLQKMLESDSSGETRLVEEQAVISEIDNLPSGTNEFGESGKNRAVDATGYKIQKYDSTSLSNTNTSEKARGFSESIKINH